MFEWAINIYTQILEIALPIGIVFAIGNLIVGTFMRMAFGGRIWFGK
ncbi:MAG: hypothetical protein UGF89_11240 [Acutalibacteraceae bacterium]|nr:hypothetical protein [Acutalibacteraceae bacterium]